MSERNKYNADMFIIFRPRFPLTRVQNKNVKTGVCRILTLLKIITIGGIPARRTPEHRPPLPLPPEIDFPLPDPTRVHVMLLQRYGMSNPPVTARINIRYRLSPTNDCRPK